MEGSKGCAILVSISIAVIKHSNLGEDRVYFTLEFGARAKAEL